MPCSEVWQGHPDRVIKFCEVLIWSGTLLHARLRLISCATAKLGRFQMFEASTRDVTPEISRICVYIVLAVPVLPRKYIVRAVTLLFAEPASFATHSWSHRKHTRHPAVLREGKVKLRAMTKRKLDLAHSCLFATLRRCTQACDQTAVVHTHWARAVCASATTVAHASQCMPAVHAGSAAK